MISIIVPVYNTEGYIETCLESIRQQTIDDFECILVDDGSYDTSGAICDRYVLQDKRFKVIHTENQGVSAARNTGIKIAKGEFLTFIDSDDYIDPYYLELLLGNISKGGLSACNMRNKGDSIRLKLNEHLSPAEAQISCFSANGMSGCVGGKLYDGEVVRRNYLLFDVDIGICEDVLFVIRYLSCVTSISVWNHSTPYFYRRNNDGAVIGRYNSEHVFNWKETSEITALERCYNYLIQDDSVKKACDMRTVKAATNTLRVMISNGAVSDEYFRLRKIVKKSMIQCLFSNCLAMSSKISIILSSISPKLELWFWRRIGH